MSVKSKSIQNKSKDERLRKVSKLKVLLNRPELGALGGSILVFIFFGIVAGDTGMFSAYGTINFLEVSAKVPPNKFAKNEEELRAFQIFEPPSAKECEDAGLYGIHLGDFIFWDEEKQTEFIRDTYEWLEDDMEGTYKGYKSVECSMAGLHDFTNYLKRGYGRSTFHASMDIRNGLLDRNEAFELAEKYDEIEPSVLQYYLQITSLSKDEFYDVIGKKRLKQLDGKTVSVVSKKYKKIKKPFVLEFIENVRKKVKKERLEWRINES